MSVSIRILATSLTVLMVPVGMAVGQPAPRDEATAVDFFEKKVRPVLAGHCYNCHSADTKPAGGLRVDDRKGLLDGGDTGPAVVPGDPEKSLLLRRVVQEDPRRRMPKEGEPLDAEQVADLTGGSRTARHGPPSRCRRRSASRNPSTRS
jgi:hypothetical protein